MQSGAASKNLFFGCRLVPGPAKLMGLYIVFCSPFAMFGSKMGEIGFYSVWFEDGVRDQLIQLGQHADQGADR